MKRIALIAAVLLAVPTAAVAAPVSATDFQNFTYPIFDEQVTVVNGEFTRDNPDNRMFFQVMKVVRGDFDQNGSPDAIVVTGANTGGTGFFTDGLIYVDGPNGQPTLFGTLGMGDRADGGVFDVRIVSGRIVVERFGQVNSGACCANRITTTTLRRSGSGLTRVGATTRRVFVQAGEGTAASPARLRFLKGTSTGTVEGDASLPKLQVAFDAGKGQRLTLLARRAAGRGPFAPVRVDVRLGTRTIASLRPGQTRAVRLPANGRYRLRYVALGPTSNRRADAAVDVTLR